MRVPKRNVVLNTSAPSIGVYRAAPVPSNGAAGFVLDRFEQPETPLSNGNSFDAQFSSRQQNPLFILRTGVNQSLVPSGELSGQISFQPLVSDNLVSPDGN
jgi:hypothetical protein